MSFLLDAILLGLTLAMMPGPIFIVLIETALSCSRREGLFVGFGIWLSDIIIMALCLIFVDQISDTVQSDDFKMILGLVGGTILMAMGVNSALKKPKKIVLNTEKKKLGKDLLSFSSKGFFINTLNPFTFIFWLGVIMMYSVSGKLETSSMVLFLSTIVIIISITDIAKIILADRVSNLITGKAIERISKISGIGMILFGIILIARAFL